MLLFLKDEKINEARKLPGFAKTKYDFGKVGI
jgi:hypothetical protein